MAIDGLPKILQANQYSLGALKPLEGGAQGAAAVGEKSPVQTAGKGAYSNIALIDGELHPETRNEFQGQKLYMLA